MNDLTAANMKWNIRNDSNHLHSYKQKYFFVRHEIDTSDDFTIEMIVALNKNLSWIILSHFIE